MPKHIVVTGGVVSSLGKGISAASIGLLLKSRGLRIAHQKFDPYLNVDPGTMNPYQHGEVYVTDDGAETDLDLGHYERFTGVLTDKNCNYTTGRIYNTVIKRERRGDYLGGTVQIIPHITDEICAAFSSFNSTDVDIVITEIGGTVGDIESLPFVEAMRQYRNKRGSKSVYFIHVVLVPYLQKAGEMKTKPAQHSVGKLREIGVIPDMLVCRSEKHLDEGIKEKLALFCNVATENVIESVDVPDTIYRVPIAYADQEVDTKILDYFGMDGGRRHLDPWRGYIDDVINSVDTVNIAIVGKYSELLDAYKSIHESLDHSGAKHRVKIKLHSVCAEEVEEVGPQEKLKDIDGIIVPGGFGSRGHEGKVDAIRYARENDIPFLGICMGMQLAVVEFARNVANLKDANSSELNPNTPYPVIDIIEDKKDLKDIGGTLRLGAYDCAISDGSIAKKLYGESIISERHRHRYEFNNEYRKILEDNGMVLSGKSPDGKLVEIVEIPNHKYFIASQFHPEFKSSPIKTHPLFDGFIEASYRS